MQTNCSNIIHIEKNKEEFEEFPIIKGLNLSLDISSIREGYKLVFEYNKEWYSYPDKMFKAYGYSTNDTNKINNSTYIMPLVVTDDFKYKDYCKEEIPKLCKNYKIQIWKRRICSSNPYLFYFFIKFNNCIS